VGDCAAFTIQNTQPLVDEAVSDAPASSFAALAAAEGSSYVFPLYLKPSAVTSALLPISKQSVDYGRSGVAQWRNGFHQHDVVYDPALPGRGHTPPRVQSTV